MVGPRFEAHAAMRVASAKAAWGWVETGAVGGSDQKYSYTGNPNPHHQFRVPFFPFKSLFFFPLTGFGRPEEHSRNNRTTSLFDF